MPTTTTFSRLIAMLGSMLLTIGCTTGQAPGPFISAEPPVNSLQIRAPRTLRLYFEHLPDVPRSTVLLDGPTGLVETRGMHTMGANDLMMEINDQLTDGVYTVRWSTYVEGDTVEYHGSYSFTVDLN